MAVVDDIVVELNMSDSSGGLVGTSRWNELLSNLPALVHHAPIPTSYLSRLIDQSRYRKDLPARVLWRSQSRLRADIARQLGRHREGSDQGSSLSLVSPRQFAGPVSCPIEKAEGNGYAMRDEGYRIRHHSPSQYSCPFPYSSGATPFNLLNILSILGKC